MSDVVNAATYSYHPNNVVSLGASFDPVDLSRAYRRCLEFDFEYSIDQARTSGAPSPAQPLSYSGETQFSIAQVRSQKDLYTYLHISGSVSGHYALFSAGASFELEDEKRFHEDSFSWVMKAESNYGRFAMNNPRLAPFADELARRDLPAFHSACGYEFVAQTKRSVLAAAVYTIRNMSQDARHKVEAQFNASVGGGIWGVNAGLSYSDFLKSAASQGVIELSVYVVGGPGITKLTDVALDEYTSDIKKTKELLVSYVKEMGAAASVPTHFVSGSLSAFVPTLANIDFDHYVRTIDDLFFVQQELRGRASRVREFVLNSGDFAANDAERDEWIATLDAIDALSDRVVAAAQNCRLYFHGLEGEAVALAGDGGGSRGQKGAGLIRIAALSRSPQSVVASGLPTTQNLTMRDSCSIPSVASMWKLKEPPRYPFALEYELLRNQNAAGIAVINLVLRVVGPRIARVIVYNGRDTDASLNSVLHAAPTTGGQQLASGSIDVTALSVSNDWLRVEVRTLSGRSHPVLVPLK